VHGRQLEPWRRGRDAVPARELRQELVEAVLDPLDVRLDVQEVVLLVIGGSDRVVQVLRRAPERRVDEPALALAGPDSKSTVLPSCGRRIAIRA
jgi:hypothetical protein